MGVVPDEIDHNELRVILKSLKIKVRDLKNDVQPLLQKLKEGELKTSRGISFLEVKYQVLLQYISQLAIFAYAKLSGKQIEGHSLIESLVELRIVLERIKPIEAKLKYQIDKLVRQSVLESQAPGQAVDDPLSFKPNPMSLMDKEGQDENEDNDSDDGSEPTSGVYRPPKMAPVTYNELSSKTSKKDKDEQRMRERATRSSMMKDLMVDMNDAPEESGVYGGVHDDINFRSQMDRKLAEKKDYEENNYVRLQVTRKEKKHLRNKDRMLGREFEVYMINSSRTPFSSLFFARRI
ncbi:hypothetical protein BC940DRAFT_313467 [Gongronella butleri]|nr:hypothetical protein BC940DRAFT_313467 [Gongronella butleri]